MTDGTRARPSTGGVAPIWNYVTAHVYGQLVVRAAGRARRSGLVWVERLVRELTERHEVGRARPWSVNAWIHCGAVARGCRHRSAHHSDRAQVQLGQTRARRGHRGSHDRTDRKQSRCHRCRDSPTSAVAQMITASQSP
ncbi:FMN-binding negative transcriptional regulator [Nocardia terpenica]|uniref:FMN-binding negative transcriptional regulator n=1 Tax=Nocardia terpenica TaxID=455432 RepID=UPI0018E06F34